MKKQILFSLFFICFFTFSFASNLLFSPVVLPDIPELPNEFNVTGLSTKCNEQILEISATNPSSFLTMIRSWGNYLGDTGQFYDCSQLPDAIYCLATLDISMVNSNNDTVHCNTKIGQCNIGVCVPSECSSTDINLLLDEFESKLGYGLQLNITDQKFNWISNCQVDTSLKGNSLAIIGFIALGIIASFVLLSSFIHMVVNGSFLSLFIRVDVPTDSSKQNPSKKDQSLEFKNVASGPSDLSLSKSIQNVEEVEIDDNDNDSKDSKDDDNMNDNNDTNELTLQIEGEAIELSKNEIFEDEGDVEEYLLTDDSRELSNKDKYGYKENEEERYATQVQSNLTESFTNVIPQPIINIASCFSIPNNYNKLLNPIPGDFGSLNGLRFFSMLWVIWGHTLFFWAQIGASNLGYAYGTFIHQFFMQAAMSGIFAVDSFFFLSGFLGAYFLYERLLEGKGMDWFLIYFHRIWRILPVYTFIMLIYVTIIPVLGDGPFWFKLTHIIETTSPNCWSNLLFINNIYPTDEAEQCMGWGWFLAVDMQFFLVSPFIIFIHYKKPILGWSILIVWLAQDLTTSVVLSAVRGYSPSIIKAQPHFFAEFYQRPYCRASPYIVGMSCGYLYSYIKRNKPDFKIPTVILHIGYALSLSTMAVIVFGIYWDDQWNQLENSLYLGFSRFAWGLCIAYLNMTMFLGYGGILRKFFFARLWQPLAKLTYGAYLSHPIFMWLFYFNQWEYVTIQNRNMWYYFIGHGTCAFAFAVIAYLLIEKPFMNLEPLLIKGVIKLVFKIRNKPLPEKFK